MPRKVRNLTVRQWAALWVPPFSSRVKFSDKHAKLSLLKRHVKLMRWHIRYNGLCCIHSDYKPWYLFQLYLWEMGFCSNLSWKTYCSMYKKEKSKLEFFLSFFIHHFHIHDNASCLLPNMMHNHCLRFLLELLLYPGGIKMQNFGGLIRCIMVYLKIVNKRERANPALSQIKLYL